jgi:hypothetical protein
MHRHTQACICFYSRKAGKCLLFCFYCPAIISLLVLATETDWTDVLRDQTVMTLRPLIWVLTESPISIFPALRKSENESTWSLLSLLLAEMPSLNYDSRLCQFRRLI